MWIFTKYGFFSAVCARDSSNKPLTTEMMIRARSSNHLQNLKDRFPQLDEPIQDSASTDYRYRLITSKSKWVEVLSELGQEIDYSNFKSKVAAVNGLDRYEKALHEVWSVMYSIQK